MDPLELCLPQLLAAVASVAVGRLFMGPLHFPFLFLFFLLFFLCFFLFFFFVFGIYAQRSAARYATHFRPPNIIHLNSVSTRFSYIHCSSDTLSCAFLAQIYVCIYVTAHKAVVSTAAPVCRITNCVVKRAIVPCM